jgi:mono/diheme cytochrome c family protein
VAVAHLRKARSIPLKGFILGVVVTLLAIALGAYIYFSQGYAPVATGAQAMPFEKKLANMALHARVEKEMPKTVPIQPSEAAYVAGAHDYVEHCAVCHGVPNKPQTAIAKGEFPKPPSLFKGKGVTDDPPNETYWKIANGIRLTGMPAFDKSLSETQMWQISLLLANADKLPASATKVLSGAGETAIPPAATAAATKKTLNSVR